MSVYQQSFTAGTISLGLEQYLKQVTREVNGTLISIQAKDTSIIQVGSRMRWLLLGAFFKRGLKSMPVIVSITANGTENYEVNLSYNPLIRGIVFRFAEELIKLRLDDIKTHILSIR